MGFRKVIVAAAYLVCLSFFLVHCLLTSQLASLVTTVEYNQLPDLAPPLVFSILPTPGLVTVTSVTVLACFPRPL